MGLNWELASGNDDDGNDYLHIGLEGDRFATISISPDAPEDHTVSRLGLEETIEKIIKCCWPDRLIFKYGVDVYGNVDYDNDRGSV